MRSSIWHYRAQAPFDMDFTTVDVAETSDGPIVFEVSAFGGFRGALEGAGIDAAGSYTDYVHREAEKHNDEYRQLDPWPTPCTTVLPCAIQPSIWHSANAPCVSVPTPAEHIEQLTRYFSHVVGPASEPDIEIIAIEREQPELDIEFIDWKREPGKSGRKDSYHDFPGGRLVRKVRTGMVFLQSRRSVSPPGPCIRYDNQVINFINAQYMNWLQNRGWLICHAAGLVHRAITLGIAGFSGGGKSTLMLHMMENPRDQLPDQRPPVHPLRRCHGPGRGHPQAAPGEPGHHRPQSTPAFSDPVRRAASHCSRMPNEQLWELEEKYDVLIDQVYGQGPRHHRRRRWAPSWCSTGSATATSHWSCKKVDLSERRDLLGAIMKSPGPFYQFADGSFFDDDMPFNEQAYLDTLQTHRRLRGERAHRLRCHDPTHRRTIGLITCHANCCFCAMENRTGIADIDDYRPTTQGPGQTGRTTHRASGCNRNRLTPGPGDHLTGRACAGHRPEVLQSHGHGGRRHQAGQADLSGRARELCCRCWPTARQRRTG